MRLDVQQSRAAAPLAGVLRDQLARKVEVEIAEAHRAAL
jgi:hypothetical protein